jgi:hypothetical protein
MGEISASESGKIRSLELEIETGARGVTAQNIAPSEPAGS